MNRFLAVGFGAATLAAVQSLRLGKWAGHISVLADELCLHDRPPLSKQFLSGEWDESRLDLIGADALTGLGLDVRWGVRAVALDLDRRTVTDSTGMEHPFDELLVATGVKARRLNVPGAELAHTLRTAEDVQRMLPQWSAASSVAVVGAGFLGLEVAATARAAGKAVTLIEVDPDPLVGRIGSVAAEHLLELHRSNGVTVRLGESVTRVERLDEGFLLRLAHGGTYTADVVIMAVGGQPATEWLDGSGLDLTDGVVCDEYGRAAEHVWAAGDVASWFDPEMGAHARVEHRMNASDQGRSVAHTILGRKPAARLPFFWTDQFDGRLQVVGDVSGCDDLTVVHGSPAEDRFVMAGYADGRLTCALNWNAAPEMMPYRRDLTRAVASVEAS